MFPVLFRHNKTPKVFCLTFGVHVISESRISIYIKYFIVPVLFVFLIIRSTSFIPYDYRTYIFTKDFYELIYGISVNKIFYRTSTYITIISNNEYISGRRINHKYIDQRDCK